jgi:ferredoxin
MLEILERLCLGQGRPADLDELQELGERVRRTSLCGLGRTAPNPVLTTLRYFHDEYEAHLQGRCPAKKCLALIRYVVTDKCIGCTRCAQRCPVEAIEARPYEQHEIDATKCVRCGMCKAGCPADAIVVE